MTAQQIARGNRAQVVALFVEWRTRATLDSPVPARTGRAPGRACSGLELKRGRRAGGWFYPSAADGESSSRHLTRRTRVRSEWRVNGW